MNLLYNKKVTIGEAITELGSMIAMRMLGLQNNRVGCGT